MDLGLDEDDLDHMDLDLLDLGQESEEDEWVTDDGEEEEDSEEGEGQGRGGHAGGRWSQDVRATSAGVCGPVRGWGEVLGVDSRVLLCCGMVLGSSLLSLMLLGARARWAAASRG